MLERKMAERDVNGELIYILDPKPSPTKTGTFHHTTDGHNKWWRFTYDVASGDLLTEWGPLDSTQTQDSHKPFQNHKDVERLVTSKLRKGYYEVVDVQPEPAVDESLDWNDALDAAKEQEYEIEDLVDWLAGHEDNTFAQSLVSFYDERGFLTPSQIESARNMREQESDPVTEPGLYRTPDGTELRVQRAKKGHLYALVQSVTGEWDLLNGGMKNLRGSMRVGNDPYRT